MDFPAESKVKSLIRVALGKEPADIFIENGNVVNVFSREIVPCNVAIKDHRIAYVGPEKHCVSNSTKVVDADGFYLVPGLIEPHAHPFFFYNPVTYAAEILSRGITSAISDSSFLFLKIGPAKFAEFIPSLEKNPFKYLWFARINSPTTTPWEKELFSIERVSTLLDLNEVAGLGETTHWTYILDEVPNVIDSLVYCQSLRKRLDGHTAGAKGIQLAALAAAGISGCHESITIEQALERLRLGMYVTLRHSSLRPDLEELVKIITVNGVDTSRLLLTTDGSMPKFIKEEGHVEGLVQRIISYGVDPLVAIQMATINPASYYRIDDQIGSISPGRYADLLLLKELSVFKPALVIANGIVVAKEGELLVNLLEPDWEKYNIKPLMFSSEVDSKIFDISSEHSEVSFPVIRLSSAVLTRREDIVLPVKEGVISPIPERSILKAAHMDLQRRTVTNGFISEFIQDIDAFATSFSVGAGAFVVGKDAKAMAWAVDEVCRLGGGMVLINQGSIVLSLPLPLLGLMTREPFDKLVEMEDNLSFLMKKYGYRYHDFIYTVSFIGMSALPEIRLTPGGVYDYITNKILYPARSF